MSIFVFILIYIGFAGIKFLLRQMTSNTQMASEELTEVFPTQSEICDDEEEVVLDNDFVDTTVTERTEPSIATPQHTTAAKEPEKAKEPIQTTERIAFTTRNEARRAFIYTEIFNRKYE